MDPIMHKPRYLL
jgi:hypothetical protein